MDVDMTEPEFGGRVAVVTGGASGIGREVVALLAARGARVVSIDRDRAAGQAMMSELWQHGLEVEVLETDITDPQQVTGAVESVLSGHGGIDVLVNNAGTTTSARPLWETPQEIFEHLWRVHLFGTYLMCRAVVPSMISVGNGRIVNVASVAGKEGNPGSSAYSAAKGGVIALTKSLGKELAQTGVLANVVTPGVIRTPLVDAATPEHIDRLLAKIPMGRAGEPSEVAELIAWLSSARCSFSTGAVFDISGGRTTY